MRLLLRISKKWDYDMTFTESYGFRRARILFFEDCCICAFKVTVYIFREDPSFLWVSQRMPFGVSTKKLWKMFWKSIFQIPVDGEKLTVPKAFYHYSENEMSAGGSFGLPDETRLLDTDGKFVNNRKEINGIYLPLPNMEPINLHFVNQKFVFAIFFNFWGPSIWI